MKLLAIGHLCIDVAHPRSGVHESQVEPPPGDGALPVGECWGGIANAIATLGSLAAKGDVVIPVCGAGRDDLEAFRSWLAQFPAVDPGAVFSLDLPTNRMHVYEQDGGTRVACTRDISPPIPYERIRKVLAVDGIVINMVSGADITIETLDNIRMDIRGKSVAVHLDYHHLTTGINEKNERFRRPLPDWRRWAFMNTSVQCNESEIAGLALERLTEEQTAGHFLTLGVKGVVVTRGAKGVTLYTSEHKKVIRHDVAGLPVQTDSDVTGLGDVFGAAFLRSFAAGTELAGSAVYANGIAAQAATLPRAKRAGYFQFQ
jgi:hypothetical protein